MYIRITTRCNMRCAHCGFNCGPIGEDMDFDTFKKAVALKDYVFIGGGEPTVHPMFWNFIMYVISRPYYEPGNLALVTNGKRTDDAIALARMAQSGLISVELSQDQWHEPIDPAVVKAFTKFKTRDHASANANDLRGIRTIDYPINSGRCDFGHYDGCICSDVVIKPDGKLRFCGCDEAPIIGSVSRGIQKKYQKILEEHEGECWKDYQETAA